MAPFFRKPPAGVFAHFFRQKKVAEPESLLHIKHSRGEPDNS
jgi:hypothetical protein